MIVSWELFGKTHWQNQRQEESGMFAVFFQIEELNVLELFQVLPKEIARLRATSPRTTNEAQKNSGAASQEGLGPLFRKNSFTRKSTVVSG